MTETRQPTRWFPVMGKRVAEWMMPIPWSVVAPHEEWAQRNHSQSLERLAERGGLTPHELVCLIEDKPLFPIAPWEASLQRLAELVFAEDPA